MGTVRVALVVVLVMVPVVASAQPADNAAKADRLAAEAEALATAGNFGDAAARFREAYRLDPRADLLCNVGVAFHKAKDLPRSQLYLGQCLRRAGSLDAGFAVAVRNVLGAVEDKLRAGDFAPIDVALDPDTASFTVSAYSDADRIIGSQLVWLPLGTHTLVATAEGHVDRSENVEVKDRTPGKVAVVLARKPIAVVTNHDTGGGPDPVAVPENRRSRIPAVIATVATGAAAGGAIAVYLMARSRAKSAGEAGIPLPAYNQRVDDARRLQKISWGLAGLAGVGAVVSGYLWYRATRSPATRVEVAPSGDGAAVWISGEF
jgi:hypothetical protein